MSKMVQPIRVVMIIQAFLPRIGGAERQLAAQAPLLQKLNVEVHIITRRYPGMAPFELINGVPVHRMPIVGPRPLAALTFVISALWKINQLRPDLLHAHELLSPATAAVLAKWRQGIPVFAKVLRGGQLGDISKIKAGWIGRLRIAFVRRSVDAFAVISNEIDQELASIGVPTERRIFLPNGVDIERFSPISEVEQLELRKQLKLPTGRLVIYSGRLQPEKNVDQLIAVWRRIRAHYSDVNLIILGTGPEENRLRRSAGSGVNFLGMVEDVIPYLRVADLYVLPSSTEGLSNSLLEAMACGLPVIATRVGAAPEMVKHKERGWLIPPGSLPELEMAIGSLLDDDVLRKKMGRYAREHIVENYALPSIVLRLRRSYDQLLAIR